MTLLAASTSIGKGRWQVQTSLPWSRLCGIWSSSPSSPAPMIASRISRSDHHDLRAEKRNPGSGSLAACDQPTRLGQILMSTRLRSPPRLRHMTPERPINHSSSSEAPFGKDCGPIFMMPSCSRGGASSTRDQALEPSRDCGTLSAIATRGAHALHKT